MTDNQQTRAALADLTVKSAALEESVRQLRFIQTEFEEAVKDRDERRDIWGHKIVTDAMTDFVHDWRIKRGKLTEQIGGLREKLEKTATTFNDAEAKLKKALEKKGE